MGDHLLLAGLDPGPCRRVRQVNRTVHQVRMLQRFLAGSPVLAALLICVFLHGCGSQEADLVEQAGAVDSSVPAGYIRQAHELYAEGPSRAPEIIELLLKAIEQQEDHLNAHYLLGVTYFGTDQLELALAEFDRALNIVGEKGKALDPELLFYRARTLFELGRCLESRVLLKSHRAFWQDGGRLQRRYERLFPKVDSQCGDSSPGPPGQPPGIRQSIFI